jgi:hypothetical protein
VDRLSKDTAEIETGVTEKSSLGPGKQAAKTWFSLDKLERKLANYQCLLLLTVLPLNYFMTCCVGLTVNLPGLAAGPLQRCLQGIPVLCNLWHGFLAKLT